MVLRGNEYGLEMPKHGGVRPNQRGRPVGSKNKKTIDHALALFDRGITPLEYMMTLLREPDVTQMKGEDAGTFLTRCSSQRNMRLDAAKAAAPYMHPRLAQVTVKEDEDQFKKKQDMDITEVARRIAYIFAMAKRKQDAERIEGREGGVVIEARVSGEPRSGVRDAEQDRPYARKQAYDEGLEACEED